MPSLTIIMYHYVRDVEETDFPALKALSIGHFRSQIEKLEKEYEFISLAQVASGKKMPPNACVLSFDDGLKDHYQNIFPILKEKNISGAFFPITCSFDGVVADVHKIHFLLAKCGAGVLVNKFHEFLKSRDTDEQKKYFISGQEKIDPRYRFDDILTANLKVRLNTLPDEIRSAFLDIAFRSSFGDESKLAEQLYLSKTEIKEMALSGMTIGSHTVNHRRLDTLSVDEQHHELMTSKEQLEALVAGPIISLSYPYGSYNNATLEIARDLGYSIALGTEVGVNEGKMNPFALKRLNANDL